MSQENQQEQPRKLDTKAVKKAREELQKICANTSDFRMSIPVKETDSDMVIGKAFEYAEELEKKLNKSVVFIENQKNTIKNLEGYNSVLQGCIEKIVGTANEVITELNNATKHLEEAGE